MALVRTAAVTALAGLVLSLATVPTATARTAPAVPGQTRPPVVRGADLPRLQAELTAVSQQVQDLALALEQAASRDGGLRVAVQDLERDREDARAALDRRVREVYMAGPLPLDDLVLPDPALQVLQQRVHEQALRVDQELIDAVSTESQAAQELRAQAEAFREQLRVQATDALAAQDRARALLAQAREALAAEAARAAADAAARAAAQAEQQRLTELETQLDAASATVTQALTPAQTDRSRNAASSEAPVLALVEAAGAGYPQGYVPSGQVFSGEASWYGPGFVGNPTASGTPYDPERQTCAHKSLPLGTVLHVTSRGRATNCLVNDRGPYAGGRVLDLSRAGSRALGFDGLAPVVAEVLVPG